MKYKNGQIFFGVSVILTMRKIILASTSPRRKELLEKTGLLFEIVGSNYEEDITLQLLT